MFVRRGAVLLISTLGVLGVLALGASPVHAKGCSLAGKERKLGPSYTTSLTASGTSCATAYRVVRAYDTCRKRNGGRAGRCRKKVKRFSCSERRLNMIDTQYDAKVSCRRGAARVKFAYTQFT